MTAEPTTCSTPCDDDCDAVCHESHVAGHKKKHPPWDCPASDQYDWGNDFIANAVKELRAERDKARAEAARYRSFCGEALCGDVERDRDTLLAENAELRSKLSTRGDLITGLDAEVARLVACLAERRCTCAAPTAR